jgi:hypothetical protein
MAETAPFPYETRLNILHPPLEIIDVHAVPGANEFKWFNQTLCKVNDSVVRMAAIEVRDGLEDRMVSLRPGQGFVVPKTVVHRTRAPRRTTILMVENAGIIPTVN